MNGKPEILDEQARALFEELGGIDTANRLKPLNITDLLDQSLRKEEERVDGWRVHLVEFVHLLSSLFLNIRFDKGEKTEAHSLLLLEKTIGKLRRVPVSTKEILIRFRGFPNDPKMPKEIDYEILYDDIIVDAGITASVIKRLGFHMSHYMEHLIRAFEVFSDLKINNLFLDLASDSPKCGLRRKTCFRMAARFFDAADQGKPIFLLARDRKVALPLVLDETGHPDPNLTFMAAINHIKPATSVALVQKIHAKMTAAEKCGKGSPFASVFDAVFGTPSLKAKLKKPDLQINNLKWFMVDREKEEVNQEKARVAKLASETGASPVQTAKVLKSVYGKDYERIGSMEVGERLQLTTGLLTSAGDKQAKPEVESEILINMEKRLEEVSDDVYDNIIVDGDVVSTGRGSKKTIIGKIHAGLVNLVSFYKKRAFTKKKIRGIAYRTVDFDLQDFETIARDFDITKNEARQFIESLKSCFSAEGRFLKGNFSRLIPEFVRYEKRIFEFLWHHLKDAVPHLDRTAFLNSLQLLIARLKRPKKAIRVLLEDLCADPASMRFADRKAFMLANLLTRRYNKEALVDFEITPEEVLLVKDGLDQDVARYAAWRVDKDQDKFFQKIRTFHKRLAQGLDTGDEGQAVSVHYLFAQEREAYIFLALVGGATAKSVLLSAAKEYGSPDSDLYKLAFSPQHIPTMLNHLRVVIRGLARVGDETALPLLAEIRNNEPAFLGAVKTKPHRELVARVMEWVDTAMEEVRGR